MLAGRDAQVYPKAIKVGRRAAQQLPPAFFRATQRPELCGSLLDQAAGVLDDVVFALEALRCSREPLGEAGASEEPSQSFGELRSGGFAARHDRRYAQSLEPRGVVGLIVSQRYHDLGNAGAQRLR